MHPKTWYTPNRTIRVKDKMQTYTYTLAYKIGTNIKNGGDGTRHDDFEPYYTPPQMLRMGVFEGKYMNDGRGEFPKEWYTRARLTTTGRPDPALNYFKIKSRLSLQEWRRRGWVPVHQKDRDIRGWFQWYCRYYLGRRIPEVDAIQIKRWKAFARHSAQVKKNAPAHGNPASRNLTKRTRQRQALLQWSWDCMV